MPRCQVENKNLVDSAVADDRDLVTRLHWLRAVGHVRDLIKPPKTINPKVKGENKELDG